MGDSSNLDKHFLLVNDIDASATKTWNNMEGFKSIGSFQREFTGSLDGSGYAIKGLNINYKFITDAGLFGYIGNEGKVSSLTLTETYINGGSVGGIASYNNGTITDCDVFGSLIGNRVVNGGIAGYNRGSIESCTFSGQISGGPGNVGGLVGNNFGIISKCSADGSVTGERSNTGGLVGDCYSGSISNCHANVKVAGEMQVGGLIGSCDKAVDVVDCHATGDVEGYSMVGGFVGWSYGDLLFCLATGNVSASSHSAGGLAGSLCGGIVTYCFGTGNVFAGENGDIGGFAGSIQSKTEVSRCFSTSDVSGYGDFMGGFTGVNAGSITDCYAVGDIECFSKYCGGLVGRNNGEVSNYYYAGVMTGSDEAGGLIGENWAGSIETSFWDVETTGRSSSDGGTGKESGELKERSTYEEAGWDFDSIWDILEGDDYPYLRMPIPENEPAIMDQDVDGLPDSWETCCFSDLEEGPGDDPDNDGQTNLEEYQRGKDPLIQDSPSPGEEDTDGEGGNTVIILVLVLTAIIVIVAICAIVLILVFKGRKRKSLEEIPINDPEDRN